MWSKIRDHEFSEGQKVGKSKEKILDKGLMMQIAN